MLNAIYLIEDESYELVYPKILRDKIKNLVNIEERQFNKSEIEKNPMLLKDIDIIMAGWGMPILNDKLLSYANQLKAIFYAAGSIKEFITDEFWERKVLITSAYEANAIPVAEFTLAQIILSLKRCWHHIRYCKENKEFKYFKLPGTYKSTVGLVSLGAIGTKVRKLLKILDVEVLAYTAHPSQERAKKLDVKFCSLEELFKRCDVISIHTPWLKETEGMIDKKLISLMKRGATLINTSRGAVIKEKDLIEVLKIRKDIYAILDVTYPEPPSRDSSLYQLSNVVLTPHIAGSKEKECSRMGEYMLEELQRYLNGEQLKWQIRKKDLSIKA